MTAADLDLLLDRVVAFDREERRQRETMRPPSSFARHPMLDAAEGRALSRRHELARAAMRDAATPEQRTWYRLEVLRLERALTKGRI